MLVLGTASGGFLSKLIDYIRFFFVFLVTVLVPVCEPKLTIIRPTKHTHTNSAQITLAASSLRPAPKDHPLTGPRRDRKRTGRRRGSQASTAIQPKGLSSAGACRLMVPKRFKPEKATAAPGAARMNGRRTSVDGVDGR